MDERITCNEPGHIPFCPGAAGGDHQVQRNWFREQAIAAKLAAQAEDSADDAAFGPDIKDPEDAYLRMEIDR